MRIVLVLLLVLMPIVMTPTNTSACTGDMDCQVGSKCVKSRGQMYGVCVGGMSPGNKNDQVPVYNPLEINRPRTFGNTCSFNLDCGIGQKCVKELGKLDGVCLPRNR